MRRFIFVSLLSFSIFSIEKQTTEDNYKNALKFYKDGQLKEALQKLKENFKLSPPHRESLELIAEIQIKRKDFIKAIATYKILIKRYYAEEVLMLKNGAEMEEYVKTKLSRGDIPSKEVLSYIRKISNIFLFIREDKKLHPRDAEYKALTKGNEKYSGLYNLFTMSELKLINKRKTLENSAIRYHNQGNHFMAVKTYRTLVSEHFDPEILSIQDRDDLDRYLDIKLKSKIDSSISFYFQKMAENYHSLAKKLLKKVSKEKLKKIVWLRDKYIYTFNRIVGIENKSLKFEDKDTALEDIAPDTAPDNELEFFEKDLSL